MKTLRERKNAPEKVRLQNACLEDCWLTRTCKGGLSGTMLTAWRYGALGRVGGGFALLAKAVHAGAKLWSRTHAHVRGNEKEGIRRCTCGVQLWTQQYHRPMERKSAGSQCCSRWKQALQKLGGEMGSSSCTPCKGAFLDALSCPAVSAIRVTCGSSSSP